MKTLDGRVAVVTGAGNGIGHALARELASAGCRIVVSDIEATRAEAVALEIEGMGIAAHPVRTDVTDASSVDDLRSAALSRFGVVHLLCNIAGVSPVGTSIADAELVDWQWAFEVNVMGTVQCLKAFLPTLAAQDEAHIVNMASITAFAGGAFNGPYCASKAAILSLSESLYGELRADHSAIGVSVVCPASVVSTIGASESRRPARLARAERDHSRSEIVALLQRVRADGMPAETAAAHIVEAIRSERFYVLTHPLDQQVRGRVDRALAGLPPALRPF